MGTFILFFCIVGAMMIIERVLKKKKAKKRYLLLLYIVGSLSLISLPSLGFDKKTFEEEILPDFEHLVSYHNGLIEAHTEVIDAAETYIALPTDENYSELKDCAIRCLGFKPGQLKTEMLRYDYIMDDYGLPSDDYAYLFIRYQSSLYEIPSWVDPGTWRNEDGTPKSDFDLLNPIIDPYTIDHTWGRLYIERERVYMMYTLMDMTVDLDPEYKASVRTMMRRCDTLFPEDCEWLDDHAEIEERRDTRVAELTAQIDSMAKPGQPKSQGVM